jgi:hypothetical protein
VIEPTRNDIAGVSLVFFLTSACPAATARTPVGVRE